MSVTTGVLTDDKAADKGTGKKQQDLQAERFQDLQPVSSHHLIKSSRPVTDKGPVPMTGTGTGD